MSNAAEGRDAVRTLRGGGAEFVKVYSFLPRDAYFAVADEAKRQGLPFAGHVPHSVTVVEASDSGQRSIEHFFYVDVSSAEDDLRRERTAALARGETQRLLDSAFDRAVETLDDEKVMAVGRHFARNGTWFLPTLIASRGYAFINDPEYVRDQRRRYLPQQVREWWQSEEDNVSTAVAAQRQLYYAADLRVVRLMHAAGAQILAGSDMVNPNVLPGFGLHDELELLVHAGLSPLDALRTATWNPARYLERTHELGSVEQGKYADLVLLDADPLADVRNTRRINSVILNGRHFSSADLVGMLRGAEATAEEALPSR